MFPPVPDFVLWFRCPSTVHYSVTFRVGVAPHLGVRRVSVVSDGLFQDADGPADPLLLRIEVVL